MLPGPGIATSIKSRTILVDQERPTSGGSRHRQDRRRRCCWRRKTQIQKRARPGAIGMLQYLAPGTDRRPSAATPCLRPVVSGRDLVLRDEGHAVREGQSGAAYAGPPVSDVRPGRAAASPLGPRPRWSSPAGEGSGLAPKLNEAHRVLEAKMYSLAAPSQGLDHRPDRIRADSRPGNRQGHVQDDVDGLHRLQAPVLLRGTVPGTAPRTRRGNVNPSGGDRGGDAAAGQARRPGCAPP